MMDDFNLPQSEQKEASDKIEFIYKFFKVKFGYKFKEPLTLKLLFFADSTEMFDYTYTTLKNSWVGSYANYKNVKIRRQSDFGGMFLKWNEECVVWAQNNTNTIVHEAVHFLQFQRCSGCQSWSMEGLATYLASGYLENDKYVIPAVNFYQVYVASRKNEDYLSFLINSTIPKEPNRQLKYLASKSVIYFLMDGDDQRKIMLKDLVSVNTRGTFKKVNSESIIEKWYTYKAKNAGKNFQMFEDDWLEWLMHRDIEEHVLELEPLPQEKWIIRQMKKAGN